MYGINPDRMLPNANGRKIEDMNDITEDYVRNMRDSNGILIYPEFQKK